MESMKGGGKEYLKKTYSSSRVELKGSADYASYREKKKRKKEFTEQCPTF